MWVMDGSAEFFGHTGTREGPWQHRRASRSRARSWRSGDGTHKLPVKSAVRRAIGKADGDTVPRAPG